MYYPEIKPAGPMLASEWETIGPTHIQYNPDEYIQKMYGWPSQYRGSQQTNMVPYGAAPAAPYGEHPTDQKVGLLLLLIGVGILAYYIGKSAKSEARSEVVQSNPCCPPSWLPRRRRRIKPALRKFRRRLACRQPRDESGRFVPA